jgi:adenine phosphoribosyltransferase
MDPESLRGLIRDVPDFPKPGIVFKDITPLLGDARALASAVEAMAAPWLGAGIARVAGIESRGFLLGPPVALRLGCGFAPLRKPGRLPWKALRQEYGLEYGRDTLEIHEDAARPGEKVLVVDDVLATGGTAAAALALLHRLGADPVGCAFLIELAFLGGARRLDSGVSAVLRY